MSQPEPADEAYQKALRLAGRLLRRRAYSKEGLVARLTAEGCDRAAAEQAVANLVKLGFLNETRDIEHIIGAGLRRCYGSLRIRAKLEEAGYSSPMIDLVIRRELPLELETNAAVSWLRDTFRPTGKRDLARAYAALARRGFPEDVARDAAEQVFGGEERP